MGKKEGYLQQCYERAQYQEALDGYLALANSNLNPDERAELDYRIGQCYYKKGNFNKAQIFFSQALQNSGTQELTSRCYNELGTIFYKERRVEQAIELTNKAMSLVKPGTLDASAIYNNLGRIYYQKQEYSKALYYFRMSMVIKEQNLPMDDLEMSVSYNNIGLVYMEMGDYEQALRYLEISLSIRKKYLDSFHPDIGTTYNNIARIYMQMKQYDNAKSTFDKALKIRIKVLGEKHLDTAMTYYGLALVYWQLGEYKKAQRMYEHVYHILSETDTLDNKDMMYVLDAIKSNWEVQVMK